MSYVERLGKLDQAYKKVDAGGRGARPADGDHHFRIDKVQLAEGKRGKLKGLLMCNWHLTCVSGEDTGKKAFTNQTLEGKYKDIGLSILKGHLELFGHKLKNLKSLIGKNGVLEKCVGKIVEARIDTNVDPRYYNLYFNEHVEEMPDEDDLEPAGDDDELETSEDEIDLEEEVEEEEEEDGDKEEEETGDEEETNDTEEEEEEEEESDETDAAKWALDDVQAIEA